MKGRIFEHPDSVFIFKFQNHTKQWNIKLSALLASPTMRPKHSGSCSHMTDGFVASLSLPPLHSLLSLSPLTPLPPALLRCTCSFSNPLMVKFSKSRLTSHLISFLFSSIYGTVLFRGSNCTLLSRASRMQWTTISCHTLFLTMIFSNPNVPT